MAKRRPGEQRAQLSFQRPEDLRLYSFLSKRAYEARYDLGTFILVSLQEAFKGQIEDEEVNALAEEAAAKVRYRTNAPVVFDLPESEKEKFVPAQREISIVEGIPTPQPVSMERAAREAEAQIAALDNVAAKAMSKKASARKGVPSPPPMPEINS